MKFFLCHFVWFYKGIFWAIWAITTIFRAGRSPKSPNWSPKSPNFWVFFLDFLLLPAVIVELYSTILTLFLWCLSIYLTLFHTVLPFLIDKKFKIRWERCVAVTDWCFVIYLFEKIFLENKMTKIYAFLAHIPGIYFYLSTIYIGWCLWRWHIHVTCTGVPPWIMATLMEYASCYSHPGNVCK